MLYFSQPRELKVELKVTFLVISIYKQEHACLKIMLHNWTGLWNQLTDGRIECLPEPPPGSFFQHTAQSRTSVLTFNSLDYSWRFCWVNSLHEWNHSTCNMSGVLCSTFGLWNSSLCIIFNHAFSMLYGIHQILRL